MPEHKLLPLVFILGCLLASLLSERLDDFSGATSPPLPTSEDAPGLAPVPAQEVPGGNTASQNGTKKTCRIFFSGAWTTTFMDFFKKTMWPAMECDPHKTEFRISWPPFNRPEGSEGENKQDIVLNTLRDIIEFDGNMIGDMCDGEEPGLERKKCFKDAPAPPGTWPEPIYKMFEIEPTKEVAGKLGLPVPKRKFDDGTQQFMWKAKALAKVLSDVDLPRGQPGSPETFKVGISGKELFDMSIHRASKDMCITDSWKPASIRPCTCSACETADQCGKPAVAVTKSTETCVFPAMECVLPFDKDWQRQEAGEALYDAAITYQGLQQHQTTTIDDLIEHFFRPKLGIDKIEDVNKFIWLDDFLKLFFPDTAEAVHATDWLLADKGFPAQHPDANGCPAKNDMLKQLLVGSTKMLKGLYAGCITDAVNIMYAIEDKIWDNRKEPPSDVMKQTHLDIFAKLSEKDWWEPAAAADRWIPTHMFLDLEADDVMAWLIAYTLNSDLRVVAQVPALLKEGDSEGEAFLQELQGTLERMSFKKMSVTHSNTTDSNTAPNQFVYFVDEEARNLKKVQLVWSELDDAARGRATRGDAPEAIKEVPDNMKSIRHVPVAVDVGAPLTPDLPPPPPQEWKEARAPEGHAYRVGDEVEVWSNSKHAWGRGKVEKVEGGEVTAEFALPGGVVARKTLPAAHRDLRPAPAAPVPEGRSEGEEAPRVEAEG